MKQIDWRKVANSLYADAQQYLKAAEDSQANPAEAHHFVMVSSICAVLSKALFIGIFPLDIEEKE